MPRSAIAKHLKWIGAAIAEPDYTIWGASPVMDKDGRVHLYASRWPEPKVAPAWAKSSEVAHYVAEKPEGPFTFHDVVMTGSGIPGRWDRYSAHNPEVHVYDGRYVLTYISNSDYRHPAHPADQHIGMALADSPNGPWRRVGKTGEVLADSPDPRHWTHGSQVVNPAMIKVGNKYHLYFKAHDTRPGKPNDLVYGLAIADRLEGPYVMQDEPLTGGGMIEDATVFMWKDKLCMITTDNHGQVTGVRGGGVLWVSTDGGFSFDPRLTQLAYDRIPAYDPDYGKHPIAKIYGPDPKLERPKVLMIDGKPAYLYAAGGWNVIGGQRTVNYVLKIDITDADGPMPTAS